MKYYDATAAGWRPQSIAAKLSLYPSKSFI